VRELKPIRWRRTWYFDLDLFPWRLAGCPGLVADSVTTPLSTASLMRLELFVEMGRDKERLTAVRDSLHGPFSTLSVAGRDHPLVSGKCRRSGLLTRGTFGRWEADAC